MLRRGLLNVLLLLLLLLRLLHLLLQLHLLLSVVLVVLLPTSAFVLHSQPHSAPAAPAAAVVVVAAAAFAGLFNQGAAAFICLPIGAADSRASLWGVSAVWGDACVYTLPNNGFFLCCCCSSSRHQGGSFAEVCRLLRCQ